MKPGKSTIAALLVSTLVLAACSSDASEKALETVGERSSGLPSATTQSTRGAPAPGGDAERFATLVERLPFFSEVDVRGRPSIDAFLVDPRSTTVLAGRVTAVTLSEPRQVGKPLTVVCEAKEGVPTTGTCTHETWQIDAQIRIEPTDAFDVKVRQRTTARSAQTMLLTMWTIPKPFELTRPVAQQRADELSAAGVGLDVVAFLTDDAGTNRAVQLAVVGSDGSLRPISFFGLDPTAGIGEAATVRELFERVSRR